MKQILEVKLNTTLKGDGTFYRNGLTFVGPLSDLPKAIQDAVKHKERYIEVKEKPVVEVPVEETTGINPEETEVPVEKTAEKATDDSSEVNEGETTSKDETTPTDDPPRKRRTRKPRGTKKSKLEPKE